MLNSPAQPLQQNFSRDDSSRLLRRARRAYEQGDFDKAERLCNALLQQRPENFDALHCLGQIHFRRGRLDTALVLLQAALKADLGRADGFSSLGLVFHALRRYEEALASFEEGLRLAPHDAELHNRRGVALLELGRAEEALTEFDRALAADPDHLDALGNSGNALVKLNRPGEALSAYDRALTFAPENAALLTNRAAALRRLDRPGEAVMSAARALAARPDFAEARFVESVARLTLGDFSAGWRGYESRWAVGRLAAQRRSFAAPLWLGQDALDGSTILLHAEQGSGDTVQFVRYAPLVAERGATVLLEVQPELVRLLSPMAGVAAVVARGEQLPRFDFHCPLLSLPLAFATDVQTIPANIPYIAPVDRCLALAGSHGNNGRGWQADLPHEKPLVGLVWSGGRWHDNDLNRSLRLEMLAPLFDLPDVQFVSLQHEVRDEDARVMQARANVLQIGAKFRDFADTAAAIAALDAVVAVDTAVAHLAGAMGKPLLLLLPFAADFRWLRLRPDSPWYPTARLFRQPRFGDWESVVAAVRQELTRIADAAGNSSYAGLPGVSTPMRGTA